MFMHLSIPWFLLPHHVPVERRDVIYFDQDRAPQKGSLPLGAAIHRLPEDLDT